MKTYKNLIEDFLTQMDRMDLDADAIDYHITRLREGFEEVTYEQH